ncbi:MAG: branched-chain amino acid ABC transporter substrate-binding protein [Candidatus Limnocylindrales bacterium]
MQKRWLTLISVLMAVTLVASACGGSGTSAPAASSAAAATAAATVAASAAPGEIIIASDLPTSGADASSGLPAQNGAAFAVSQTTEYKGIKITFLPFDDAVNGVHDPQKGAQNVQQMLSNPKVLAMVGPFNSNVARAEIPIANQGALAMMSPSNTNECLTQTFPYCNPQPAALRPTGKNQYFRIAAPDTVQGPAMADFILNTLKLKNVAIFSDNETFGKGVADNFAKRLVEKGGKVTNRQDFDMKATSDFKAFINAAKAAGAEAVYAGATSATKGCIVRSQMKGILDVPFTGPDGIGDTQCLKDAGDNGANMYFTNAAGEASQNPDAKATVDAFKAKFTKKEDIGAYTFPSYDCALILVDAVKRAIDANGGKVPTRQQVVDAVQATKGLKGTVGTYAFDKNGDPTSATMAFYKTTGTPLDWAFVSQFSVQ